MIARARVNHHLGVSTVDLVEYIGEVLEGRNVDTRIIAEQLAGGVFEDWGELDEAILARDPGDIDYDVEYGYLIPASERVVNIGLATNRRAAEDSCRAYSDLHRLRPRAVLVERKVGPWTPAT